MQTGGDTPSNVQSNTTVISNTAMTIIILVIAILIIIIAALILQYFVKKKEITKLKNSLNSPVNKEEKKLIIKYRALNERDKHIIENTLNTLTENNFQQDDGN